jgi:signal transduction histidine kinase
MTTPEHRFSDPVRLEVQRLDRTIQALFGLGLKLEECIHLIGDSPAQAEQHLDTTINRLNEVIGELRTRIDELGEEASALKRDTNPGRY